MDKIKLENIAEVGFDTETGDAFVNFTEEYVCGGCRHLVGKDDKYCPFCGGPLENSGKVEHYYGRRQLTDTEFKKELEQYGE